MKAFLTQMSTDGRLILRNIFLWITLGFLVLIIVVVNFLLPKEINRLPETDEIVQEYSIPIQYTYTSEVQVPPPFNKRMVPLMISLEAVMTGILLAGVLILTEKERQLIRAYRVSPAGAFSYVSAKVVLFSLVGVVYSCLIAVFTVGFDFHIGPFLWLSFLASALFTLMGMAVSVFLRSLSTWLMIMAFLIGTNTLVLFAYIFPSGAMDIMKILPAYTMIFAYERTLFGVSGFADVGLETLTLWVAGLFILCLICVRFRLLRPYKGE